MAKTFKFRLERVLEYREVIRNDKKKELLIKNQALNEAQDNLNALKKALISDKSVGQDVQVQKLQIVANYESRLMKEIDLAKIEIEKLTYEAEKAKEEYIESVKEHEALKVLRVRKQQEYQAEVSRAEDKFLDELSVQRRKRDH
ncbi:MAG: flagellar export protein FliJ [bacterium]|nr:flagellar export protein FliJ [bacterium]